MAKLSLLAGSTSKLMDIFIQDSSKTDGSGLTGLTNASSGLTWYYYREGAGASVQVTSIATMTLGTWVTKGFIVVDGTNMPGVYQIGVPDAALAAGAKSVVMMLKGVTNMAPVLIEIELTAVDNQNATSFGLTDLDAAISSRMATYTQPTGFLAATFPSGTVANTTNITAGTITTVTNLTNAPTAGDFTATMKASAATAVWTDTTAGDFTTALSIGKSIMNGVSLGTGLTVNDITTKTGYSLSGTQTFNVTGNITGNLSGSVGSVTGAVGSVTAGVTVSTNNDKSGYSLSGTQTFNVTGNITGNLSGSVGSVTGAVGSVTGNVGGSVASVIAGVTVTTNNDKTGYGLTSAYDFAKGTVAMTESYAANGIAPTPAQALFALQQYLMDFTISGTSYTVKKLDNATTAYVVTLNDATAPTAAART